MLRQLLLRLDSVPGPGMKVTPPPTLELVTVGPGFAKGRSPDRVGVTLSATLLHDHS
jgi:hypothetical protein